MRLLKFETREVIRGKSVLCFISMHILALPLSLVAETFYILHESFIISYAEISSCNMAQQPPVCQDLLIVEDTLTH